MNTKEARKVERMVAEAPHVNVTGRRNYGTATRPDYVIEAVDTINGYPFLVYDLEDWQLRQESTKHWS